MVQTVRSVYLVIILATFGQASISPCKVNDEQCLVSTANSLYASVISGDPSLGTEVADPASIAHIDGTLTILKYYLSNLTLIGYKNCEIKHIRVDAAQKKMKINLVFPHTTLYGHYVLDGRLIILPVQGHGNFTLEVYQYNTTLDVGYKVVKNENGQEYISITNFQCGGTPEKGAHFKFDNLFNGQKDLSNAVHKFANENSREVFHEFQEPILSAIWKIIIKNTNKVLKSMPMEHLFLQ